jgi:hypothetical protein
MEDFYFSAADDLHAGAAATGAGGPNSNTALLFDTTEEVDELILNLLPPEELEWLQREASNFVSRSLHLQQDIQARAQSLLADVTRDRDDALQALRQVTGEQLSSVRKGMERFSAAEKAMSELASAFAQMDSLIGTMQSVSSYNQIRQLHHYHENLHSVVKWSECFAAFEPDKSTVLSDLNEEKGRCSAQRLLEIYQQLRVMQSIRARLTIPSVQKANAVSITVVRRHIEAGEKALKVFLEKIFDIFRRAPGTMVEFVINEGNADAIHYHELLVAAVKIANEEALSPAMYEDIDVAAYQLEIAINRTAGKSDGGGGAAGGGKSAKRSLAAAANLISRPDTEVVSAINWAEISHHVDVGTRNLFVDSVCRDSSIPERAELPTGELLSNVTATCDGIEEQLEAISECVERGMQSIPVGSGVELLPHIMRTLHNEFCSLIENDYCDPRSNVVVSDLLRVLKLVVFYREQCLERGTIGQFVPPSAVERVATRVLEVAVSGMRDYLATQARNCVLRVIDKDVKPDSKGIYGTTGPGDLLYIVSTMLKSVTKNASTEVRTKMSLACATALRYYVDRFCEQLRWGDFPKWYSKIAPEENVGSRWLVWHCTAINDFLELQRNVGKLDAALFDLHHQAAVGGGGAPSGGAVTSSTSGAGAGDSSAAGKNAKISPLQAFSGMLAQDVLRKLVFYMADYLELVALKKPWDEATSESSFKPTGEKRGAMSRLVEEIRDYTNNLQPMLSSPWNAIVSRNIIFRMIQIYIQRVLAKIHDGLDPKIVTRGALSARLGDDLRLWTTACADLAEIAQEQLREEERALTAFLLPTDIFGALGALRVILRFATVDTAVGFQAAIAEDAIHFHDIPEYVFMIMFEKNKAAADLSSSVKSQIKKLWSNHAQSMEQSRKQAETARVQQLMASQGTASGPESAGLMMTLFHGGAAAAPPMSHDGNDDDVRPPAAVAAAAAASSSSKHHLATAEMIQKFTTPTIFGMLEESQVLPTKKGILWGKSRDDTERLIGYRLTPISVCSDKIAIREVTTEIPRLKRKEEIEVISLEDLLKKKKEQAAAAG